IMSRSLEGCLANEEVPHPLRAVITVEPVTVVEADDAEERDLHAEAGARTHLEMERVDLAEAVPCVAGVEEEHTVERMDNGKLLLDGEQLHEAAARRTHMDGNAATLNDVVEFIRHHRVVVVAAQRIGGGAA